MLNPIAIGYLLLALAQSSFAVTVVSCKYLFESMPMFLVTGGRFLVSTIILFFIFKLRKGTFHAPSHPEGKLTKKDWTLLILQGVLIAFLFNTMFAIGLQYASATSAGIISSSLPAIIALSAVWLLKERLDTPKIIALFLAMLGIAIVNFNFFNEHQADSSLWGNFLIFLSMFPQAWFSISSRKLAGRVDALGGAFITNLVGTCTILPIAFLTMPLETSTFMWLLSPLHVSLLLIAGLGGVIFFWGWSRGLAVIPATTAANFGSVMPVATTILAVIFLKESLHWYHTVGMLFVLLSIAIGSSPQLLRKISLSQA